MKKFNFNFKSIVRSKARWLLTLIAILTLGVGELWAGGFFTNGMWQVWGWKTGYKDDGWLATNMGSSTNYDIGIVDKSYTFKGLSANTWDSGVNYVHVWVDWPDGTHSDHNISYSSGSSDRYWESKNLWDYSINQSIPGNFTIDLWFKIKDSGDWYDEKHLMITWTTPGFTDYPEETVGFGSKNVIGLYSETTINFKHYGTALTTTCTTNITGTNASEFVVRKIEDDKVIVAFKPSTTGTRTAKLTLTDAHGKTCEINLSGSGNALGTTTRLYFNDYTNNSDWSASSAKYRFTCQYSTGVYTNYPMTLCENTTNTYYADVELKAGNISTSIDRYNPASPYVTWNSTSSLALSASKPYAISNGKYSAYVTDHPYNDITGGTFYYDNSQSGFTNNLYLIIGMDYNIADNSSKTYSANYQLNNIGNTKLSYYTYSSTAWHDATYYAVIGASSVSGDSWGSSSLSTKGTGGYTAAYKDLFGLLSGNTYLASSPSNTGGTMTITQSPTLTTTQTFNYALSTDGGTTYDPMISGSPNTPGQLKLESYYFSNATAVTKNTDLTLSANATTYTTNKNNVAYTGTTTLTESNTRDGYSFMGWYKGNSTARTNSSTHSFTYYPQGDSTYTARYKAHRYTIAFSSNDAQYSGAPAATGSTTSISNVVYDQNVTLTANGFSRTGYTFAGWSTTADGDVAYSNSQSVSNLTATDGATVTLYAQWNEILHNVTVAYKYGETSVQDDGEVEDVGIVTTKDATAPATIGGYSFTEWSDMPSNVQTSSSLTGRTITINATADGQTITANYEPSTYVGTIDGVDGGDGAYSIVYNETSLTPTTPATRDGFEVGGYYLNYDEKANPKYYNQIAAGDGSFLASISTYTDENKKWIKSSAPATIYASWTPKPYDITLHAELPGDATGSEGTSKITATMGTNTFSPNVAGRTMPSENGYNFLGYFTDDTPSNIQILNADGTNHTGTKYIDGDGNWSWADNIDAYGHWSAKTYTVSLDPENGSSTTDITATFDATTNLSRIVNPSKTGYTFEGYYTGQGGSGTQLIDEDGDWIASVSGYTGDNGSGAATWKYYTSSTITLYAKWTQTINFNQNSATVNGTTSLAATYNGTLSPGGITNPNKIGYAFAGWATAADGDVVIEPNGTVNDVDDWTEDGKWIHAGESELVATWTADVNNFKVDATTTAWGTADNWSQNKVPTEYTEVHIKGNATVSSHVYVGKVVIEEGSLTIASTGALEVASTITNTDEDKLIVNSRGALIFDNSAGSTYATVELSTTYASAGSHFQFIGLPVWGVSVSTAFAGKGVYTYAWKQGEGWERRGYYDDLMAFEAIALMGSSGYTFHGALVPTTDKEYSLSYADRENGDVYMYGNSWTAPIKVSGMTIDSYDGAHIYDGSTGSWDGAVSGDVIPAMQAFAVLAKSGTGGSVSIPYNTAVRNATSPNAPLRAPQRNTPDILDHISVYVTGNELQTRMRLFENEQFTNDIDNGYEAIHMEGEGRAGELYAQADDKMTVLATPNLEGTVVGFIPGEATNYTISFEGDGKGYYLNDVVTNQSTLIAEGNTYMFTPDESTNDTRFIISKTPIHNMPTGVDAINDGVKARKQMINGILYIIRDGRLYDATGALVK